MHPSAKRLITPAVTLFLAISVIMGTVQWFRYKSLSTNLDVEISRVIEETSNRLSNALSVPLWNFDFASIELILKYEANGRTVQSIILRDDAGAILRETYYQDNTDISLLVRHTPISYNDTKIGELTFHFIDYRPAEVEQFISRSVRDTLIGTTLLFVVIGGVIFWNYTLQNTVQERTDSLNIQLARRKKAEEELERSNRDLEKSLKEIKDLYRASQSANRAKNEFLAVISHELRTPLNAIMGFSDIMAHSAETNQSQRKHIEIIRDNANSLLSMITDILDFGTIESGKTKLNHQAFSLEDLAENIRSVYANKVAEQNLSWQVHVDEQIPKAISSDWERLRQVLINLIDNALKFTQIGQITVKISVQQSKDSQPNIVLSVEDTGEGIAEDQLKTIFEAFTQEDYSSRRQHGGVGLGLAIVDRIAKTMGGTIEVESVKGAGSTFTFSAPVHLPEEIEEPSHSESQPSKAELGIAALVVEDNPDSQKLMEQALTSRGASVDIANNGKTAVERATEKQYDVIFMDLHLPNVNGIEATRAIRDEELRTGREPTRIVGLTADTKPETETECLVAGMDNYLTKPINLERLINLLQQC